MADIRVYIQNLKVIQPEVKPKMTNKKTQFTLKEVIGMFITTFTTLFWTYFTTGSLALAVLITAAGVAVFSLLWTIFSVPTLKVSDVVTKMNEWLAIVKDTSISEVDKKSQLTLSMQAQLVIYTELMNNYSQINTKATNVAQTANTVAKTVSTIGSMVSNVLEHVGVNTTIPKAVVAAANAVDNAIPDTPPKPAA